MVVSALYDRPMNDSAGGRESRRKDGREWRIGTSAEIDWTIGQTEGGVRVNCAIPPIYEAYATIGLTESGNGKALDFVVSEDHDRAVADILESHTLPQPWWLGFLDTGGTNVVFDDAPKVDGNGHGWMYVLVEAGPEQARTWRGEDWKGWLPDMIFPADRSWLYQTLWDDDWSYLGGSRQLVDSFLSDPELAGRVCEVNTTMDDATPPGHVAF
jgi:hypothetical protein